MDPLSDVLSLLKPRSYVAGGFDVGGEWSVQFARHEGIKCYAVASGQCWLSMEGVAEPVRLNAGDCFLLPLGRPFRLASDPSVTPIAASNFFPLVRSGAIATFNGGGDCLVVGGHFVFGGAHAEILLGALPPIAHIQKESDKAALRWSLDRMRQELGERRPGGFLIAQHLAHMMLVQALRLYVAEGSSSGVGWLFALADKQMGAAIGAMHENPAYPWTLQELAERVGMSRSTFALKFKATVGAAPMEYLTRWRMLLAGDRLANSRDPVSLVARSLGYESESAFGTAFKRVMGCSPRQYGAGRNPVAAAPNNEAVARAERLESVEG
jgi:AraC-like DNA-binding protein